MLRMHHKVSHVLTFVVILVLLFFFSKPMLLWAAVLLALLPLLMSALLRADLKRLHFDVSLNPGTHAGGDMLLTLSATHRGYLLAAKDAVVELELASDMFGVTQSQRFLLPLRGKSATTYEASLPAAFCGQTRVTCLAIHVWCFLELVSMRAEPFAPILTTLYPSPAQLRLLVSKRASGKPQADGLMQNRRGSDPSEFFDIREYIPGDDIRTIHWKLSSRFDDLLIVREPSDPSHYDLALLPNLSAQPDGTLSPAEQNAAVAFTIAIAEQLLEQSVTFCFLIPTAQKLSLREVRNPNDLQRVITDWLSVQIPAQRSAGIEFFLAGRLEQYFTRLVLVGAGELDTALDGLESRIGVVAVNAANTTAPTYTPFGSSGETIILPAVPAPGASYRIVC